MLRSHREGSRALLKGALGGLLAGIGLGHGGLVIMSPALALLWSASRKPLAAFFWGAIAILISHRWLLALHPLDWIGIPSPLSLLIAVAILLFCSFISGLLVALWALIGNFLSFASDDNRGYTYPFSHVVILSCIWGLSEVILAHSPLFWIGLGGSLLPDDRFLAGLARWFGEGGLASFQLLVGWWLCITFTAFVRGTNWKQLAVLGVLTISLAHFSGWLLLRSSHSDQSIRIATWQSSIPIREKFLEKEKTQLPQAIQKSFQNALSLDASLLIAPEGTISSPEDLLSPAPIPFLSGGFRWVRGQQRSSLLVFNHGESSFSKALDKNRLVPLGEWIPFLPQNAFRGLSAVGGIQPGAPSRLLEWSGPSAAVAICYELSDGYALANAVRAGAEWILVIANLDPYPISLQRQFLALAQLRSIETSRNLIASTNTGPSSLILETGKEQSLLSPFIQGVGAADLHFHKGKTGYILWGEIPLFIFLMGGIVGLFLKSNFKN